MEKSDIIDSIACCGLICRLCHLAGDCDGCRNTASKCSNHSDHWGGCYQRKCCRGRGIKGCWECGDFPCDKEMFDVTTHDLKIRACVRCIKEDGPERFVEYVLGNEKNGIRYGFRKDYDGLGSEEEVLRLLRIGKKNQ
ncbi:conserved hypothetical protein [Methanocella paludicola SANAE]|uniref:DUF3795 domain-containing protein n=1 Tax=Methanocella paludicola (strain DSM 17711 / JCM 13418 / NBRC 101707 / SANAE) TaxID=304371 RepID=D1YXF1_METPS|nr:DUF3795 domain-containing protein [Methanocella paludicola]BAI61123.1 conserved hypothetical protein [Methanocella paludicola SANAE]